MFNELLEQIALVTSNEIAEQLAKAYGGIRVYIPKTPTPSSPIVQLIGMDNVLLIVKHIGHGDYNIPMGDYRGIGAKAKIIKKLIRQGYTVSTIALMADCCERTVWVHKQKLNKPVMEQCKLPFLNMPSSRYE